MRTTLDQQQQCSKATRFIPFVNHRFNTTMNAAASFTDVNHRFIRVVILAKCHSLFLRMHACRNGFEPHYHQSRMYLFLFNHSLNTTPRLQHHSQAPCAIHCNRVSLESTPLHILTIPSNCAFVVRCWSPLAFLLPPVQQSFANSSFFLFGFNGRLLLCFPQGCLEFRHFFSILGNDFVHTHTYPLCILLGLFCCLYFLLFLLFLSLQLPLLLQGSLLACAWISSSLFMTNPLFCIMACISSLVFKSLSVTCSTYSPCSL